MQVIINGKEEEVSDFTLLEILTSRQIVPDKVILELNGEIVSQDEFSKKKLSDGDILEIVQFVGGG